MTFPLIKELARQAKENKDPNMQFVVPTIFLTNPTS